MELSRIQKLMPSLHAPPAEAPNPTYPIGVRSAALNNETPSWVNVESVIRILSPSKAAAIGWARPLPVSVARTAPVDARTTLTELGLKLGTHTAFPSKIGRLGAGPTVTV